MRDFLKYLFASLVALTLFSALSVGGLLALVLIIAFGTQDVEPLIEDDSMLVFDLSLDITDSNPNTNPGDLLGDALAGSSGPKPIALRSVLDALEEAATDDRIAGILIQGNINVTGSGSGFATMREVRQALQTFQASGKPIVAYEDSWAERDYYVTSVADTIFMDPSGLLEMNGFSFETTFFAGALEQFGVGVQVLRAGNFKSAVEPFTRTDNSPENEQQTQELLTDLWNEFLSATSESRSVTPDEMQAIANSRGYALPTDAQQAGLIDQVAYADEVVVHLHGITGETDSDPSNPYFRSIDLRSYASAVLDTDSNNADNRIAVVYAEGAIVSGEGGPGLIGGDRLASTLREIRLDDSIQAVVLRVNSPGGGASPSEVIAHEVNLISDVKPIIVSMGTVAASGGYMISSYADQIFASPNTITGSIGVYGLIANLQDIANENGITWDVVKTGPFADVGTVARPLTQQELALTQQLVDDSYDTFLSLVTESRPLTRQEVQTVAQGRVWSGVDAQSVGLVDSLGGLDAAIQAAVEAAGLTDGDWAIDEYPRRRTLEEQILESLLSRYIRPRTRTTPLDPFSQELAEFQDKLELLNNLNDPRGIYSLMPFLPTLE